MILNHLFHGLSKVNQFLKDSVETAQARAESSSEGEKSTRTIIYDVVLAVNDIAQAIKENFEEAKIETDISVDFSADIDTNTVSGIKSDIKQTLQSIGGNLLSSTLASIAKGTGMLQALEQNNQNASSARSSGNTGGIFSMDSGYGSYYDGISSMFPDGLGAGWRLVYGDTLRGEKTADYYARQYSEEFVNRQQYLGALIFMELADDVIENRNNPYGDIESRCTWSHDKWPTKTCAERKEEAIQGCCHMWRGNIGQSIDKAMSTRAFNDVDLDHPEYYNPMDFFTTVFMQNMVIKQWRMFRHQLKKNGKEITDHTNNP